VITWDCDKEKLEPTFRDDIEALLHASDEDWHVVYGFRTLVEQDELYQKHLKGGPLAAPPGHSAHNFGLAVDVQLIANGAPDWHYTAAGWHALYDAVALAPRLHSGVSFDDPDHIERVNWHQFENWAK
jgi:D-alanyl-D-alanine carboxypeptidase-like protein